MRVSACASACASVCASACAIVPAAAVAKARCDIDTKSFLEISELCEVVMS